MPRAPDVAVGALRGPFERLCFRKRAGSIFTTELSDGVLGWIGLNRATRYRQRGEVEINPVVGIRNQAVERMVAEFHGEKFHPYLPPTVSTPIGYVMPEQRYIAWVFGQGNNSEQARDLVAAVEDHGLPFMRSLIDLPAVCDALKRRLGHDLEYRLPVVLSLVGEDKEAHTAVDRAVEDLGGRRDPAEKRMRQFASAFRRRASG